MQGCLLRRAVDRQRQHPTFTRIEVMLDAKAEVKAQLIAGRQLALKLPVALCRVHAGFVADVGEMGKLHGRACVIL